MPLDKGVPSDSSSRVLTNNMKSLQHSLKFVKECHRSKCVKRLWPRRPGDSWANVAFQPYLTKG
jgi:hypothetical protein